MAGMNRSINIFYVCFCENCPQAIQVGDVAYLWHSLDAEETDDTPSVSQHLDKMLEDVNVDQKSNLKKLVKSDGNLSGVPFRRNDQDGGEHKKISHFQMLSASTNLEK